MPAEMFDYQPVLSGVTLKLEPLSENHFEGMCQAAGDPGIWAGHPASDRYKRAVFERYFASLLNTEKALAVLDVDSGEVIGGSSFYTPPDRLDAIAIGFTFLVRAKWGGATNFELKSLMIEHASKAYDVVYFHIAPSNIRSQKATLKLGAEFLCDQMLDLSTGLQLWKCYALNTTQGR